MATKTRTYGRGILRFTSWDPCRRPGEKLNSNAALKREEPAQTSCVENRSQDRVKGDKTAATVSGVPTVPKQNGDKPVRLLAKYNYKGNPSRPGGFDELTVTQGEKLEFSRTHPSNPHWWEAKNVNGDVGFIPSTYMMVLKDKISALPWLEENKKQQNIEDEEQDKKPEEKTAFKPYVSAYAGNDTNQNNSSDNNNYYCDVCDKKLNGPIPYQMHLNSKAHKEEVEIKEEFNR